MHAQKLHNQAFLLLLHGTRDTNSAQSESACSTPTIHVVHIAKQMGKEQVLGLLLKVDSSEAGAVYSFVRSLPADDVRFLEPLGTPALVFGFWQEEKKKSEGVKPGDADIDAGMAAVIRATVTEMLGQQAEPTPFLEVSASEASSILQELDLLEKDGHIKSPLCVPGTIDMRPEFNYAKFPNEDAGTPEFIEYHQQQLSGFGVSFGPSSFQMYDTHSDKRMYQMRTPTTLRRYRGNVDCILAPSGLLLSSASREARALIEHKQNERQKAEYKARELAKKQGVDPEPLVQAAVASKGTVPFGAKKKGQAVTCMLAAYAYNDYPFTYDLTDGQVHHLLRLFGKDLYVWVNCTPTQAYYTLAQELQASAELHQCRLASIPEAQQLLVGAPNKQLSELLGVRTGGGLKEQLDAIVPFLAEDERLPVTMELISAWFNATDKEALQSYPFTETVQRMYV